MGNLHSPVCIHGSGRPEVKEKMSNRRCYVILVFMTILAPGSTGWTSDSSPGERAAVYSQAPDPSGRLLQSSRWDRDGSDYDACVWDNFTLSSNQAIGEITWRGGYDPSKARSGGQVTDFRVAIYASIAAGTQPDVVTSPLAEYRTGGKAGESPAGSVGLTKMYDYSFTLPTPFRAEAGTKYWVQIEAIQAGIPHWGIAAGTGGDGTYFRKVAGAGDFIYQAPPGDASFSLIAPR
jgi:hypothetical protein